MWLTDVQKVGVGLTAGGCLFLLLGVFALFDSALLAFGNILFLAGLTLVIGIRKTIIFFTRKNKIRGSICFGLGIFLILTRHSFIGFAIEFFGFLNLFGDFFGVIIAFLRALPIVGPILSHPSIAPYLDQAAGIRVLPV